VWARAARGIAHGAGLPEPDASLRSSARGAITGLARGAKESAGLTLTATDAHGTSSAKATVAGLHG
jgi:hypothetical protein